jgi:hypothetical protein
VIQLTRRSTLLSAFALAACGRARASDGPLPALNTLVPFPLGVAAMTGEFDDPAWTALAVTNFGRVTPEWEMKSESLVAKDGAFDWTRADRLVSLRWRGISKRRMRSQRWRTTRSASPTRTERTSWASPAVIAVS